MITSFETYIPTKKDIEHLFKSTKHILKLNNKNNFYSYFIIRHWKKYLLDSLEKEKNKYPLKNEIIYNPKIFKGQHYNKEYIVDNVSYVFNYDIYKVNEYIKNFNKRTYITNRKKVIDDNIGVTPINYLNSSIKIKDEPIIISQLGNYSFILDGNHRVYYLSAKNKLIRYYYITNEDYLKFNPFYTLYEYILFLFLSDKIFIGCENDRYFENSTLFNINIMNKINKLLY